MFSKQEIDELVAKCLSELSVNDLANEDDFQKALLELLKKKSEPTLWEWDRENQYVTQGLINAGDIYFDIVGIYDRSYKILIELKYVMGEPKDFYAFPYDMLKDCIKIELAMSGQADTTPVDSDYPVVYGLSIGLTDCKAFWQDQRRGTNAWSRNSLLHLRNQGSDFKTIETVGQTEDKKNNSIFANDRCHLSFALNWHIRWNNTVQNWRFVTISPSEMLNLEKLVFEYAHETADPSCIPFLESAARSGWFRKRDEIARNKKVTEIE